MCRTQRTLSVCWDSAEGRPIQLSLAGCSCYPRGWLGLDNHQMCQGAQRNCAGPGRNYVRFQTVSEFRLWRLLSLESRQLLLTWSAGAWIYIFPTSSTMRLTLIHFPEYHIASTILPQACWSPGSPPPHRLLEFGLHVVQWQGIPLRYPSVHSVFIQSTQSEKVIFETSIITLNHSDLLTHIGSISWARHVLQGFKLWLLRLFNVGGMRPVMQGSDNQLVSIISGGQTSPYLHYVTPSSVPKVYHAIIYSWTERRKESLRR